MTKPKNQTLIERIGFNDKDLLTENHDQILIKLLDREKAIKIFKFIDKKIESINLKQKVIVSSHINVPEEFEKNGYSTFDCKYKKECNNYKEKEKDKTYSHNECKLRTTERRDREKCKWFEDIYIENEREYKLAKEQLKKENFITLDDPFQLKIISERTIHTPSNFLIGFIDLVYEYVIDKERVNGLEKIIHKCNHRFIFDNISDIYKDFKLTTKDNRGDLISWYKRISIEIKTKIDSFGETLRQINTYRSYFFSDYFILIAPDDKFKEAFKSQNIILLTYEDINKICNGEKKE